MAGEGEGAYLMVPDILDRRPLPSFDRWLDEQNGGKRAEDFAVFAELVERTLAASDDALPPEQKAFLRMWKGMSLATVELCNIEREQHKRRPEDIIVVLSRVLACAAMYSIASVMRHDAPLRQVAKVLIEEFRFAAKESADQIMESWEQEAQKL
jgi:hypothetical protein